MADGEGLLLASSLVVCSAAAEDGDSGELSGDEVGLFGDGADVAAEGEFDGEILLADAPVPTGTFCRC